MRCLSTALEAMKSLVSTALLWLWHCWQQLTRTSSVFNTNGLLAVLVFINQH